MTLPGEAALYHVGMIVHSVDVTLARYHRLFGGDSGVFEYDKPASRIAEAPAPATRLRIGLTRAAGLTLELIEPLAPGPQADFLASAGEGVHHFGFWVPDLASAVAHALGCGAQLRSASITVRGSAVISVAGLTPSAVAAMVGPPVAFVDPGAGPEIELVGAASISVLESVLGDRLPAIVDRPPWSADGAA